MSASKTLLAATLVVGAGVAVLMLGGRGSSSESGAEADPARQGASLGEASAPSTRDPAAPLGQALALPAGDAIAHSVRALVPEQAWLVADFRGDLTNSLPFEDQKGPCQTVKAPERIALAILPPQSASGKTSAALEPELLLAAPGVSDLFWGCARERVEQAGGSVLAENDRFEVLQSPSGVVARGPGSSMIFLTNTTHLEAGLSVISELGKSAAASGVHAGLFRRMHEKGESKATVFDLTLALPHDWLRSVGEEANRSPLRFLRAGYLSMNEDGSARGGVECAEPGCAELDQFFRQAVVDLQERLGPSRAGGLLKEVSFAYQAGSGHISLACSPQGGAYLKNWATSFLGGAGFMAASPQE